LLAFVLAVTDEFTYYEILPFYKPMDVISAVMVWGDCALIKDCCFWSMFASVFTVSVIFKAREEDIKAKATRVVNLII
jgi:hypothetical protein